MAKLNNINVFIIIYKLLVRAKKEGTTINLTIYKEIDDIKTHDSQFYAVLDKYMHYVYEQASQYGQQIDMKITTSEQGLRFAFENIVSEKKDTVDLGRHKTIKCNKMMKNIFCNTFLQKDKLIQEVLVTYN